MVITIDNVLPTQDGPYSCYDAVITAGAIAQLNRSGFLEITPEIRTSIGSVKKLNVHQLKIDRWTKQLIAGAAYIGQLSWNFRKEDSVLDYDPNLRRLAIGAGVARTPDSFHRHRAILQAVESAQRGSGFNPARQFSVRIYHVPLTEEHRIFYAMNEEYVRRKHV
jgi:hypothetical protein